MIVITGATGKLGSRVLDQLLRVHPAEDVAVSVRDPDRAPDLARRGVRVRRGDFLAPETLAHAMEGADEVLVVSAAITGEQAVVANCAAIDAAYGAGARRVVYTSHQAVAEDSLFAAMPVHAATERHLAEVGRPYVALRNGFYATTLAMYVRDALRTGTLSAPADGPVSWTGHDDLARAAVTVLTGQDGAVGATRPLTGPESLDLAGVARLLGEHVGGEIPRVVVDDEKWVETTVGGGVPEAAARFLLGMFLASRRGEFDVVDPALAAMLSRPATSVRDLLPDLTG